MLFSLLFLLLASLRSFCNISEQTAKCKKQTANCYLCPVQDSFHTIKSDATGLFKDRGSKFHSYARSVVTEQEAQSFLTEIKKEHNKARHHCYGYRLGLDENNFRANDDGEPSGTAGKPILGQRDSAGLTNIMVIVVRYFGGTKLGTSGLINAYRESTRLAHENATRIEKIVEDRILLTFDYSLMSGIMNAVKKIDPAIYRQEFTEHGEIEMGIRKSETEDTMLRFKALVMNISLEEAKEIKGIAGCKVDFI